MELGVFRQSESVELLRVPGEDRGIEAVVNIYLVGDAEPYLIDTGYQNEGTYQTIREALKGRRLRGILVTHLHPDHASGGEQWIKDFGGELHFPSADLGIGGNWLGDLPQDRNVAEGQRFESGGVHILPVHTPGHTMGHTCYYIEEEQSIVTADHVVGSGSVWVGPPHGNIADYFASLRKIDGMKLERLYPGHGPVSDTPHVRINELIEHRLMRERQILRELEHSPKDLDVIVAAIYADVKKELHFLAGLTVQGHLEKLEREGIVGLSSDKLWQML